MGAAIQTKRPSGWGRAVLNRALHLIVPICLLFLIFSSVSSAEVLSRIAAIAPGWLVAALLAAQVQIVLSALRWQLTARSIGMPLPFGRALAEYYLSGAINMTVPGGVLGDGVRAIRSREINGFEAAAHAVLIERLAGQLALAVVLAAGLLLSGISTLQQVGVFAVALVTVGAILGPRLGRVLPMQDVPDVVGRFLSSIRQSWFGPRIGMTQMLLSLLIVAANLASFSFAAAATGSILGLVEVLYTVPLILFAMLIPFSIAGWGYREGAAAAIFPLIGATAAAGVSASVIFGAVILVANLPGLFVLMRRKKGTGRSSEHENRRDVA